MCNNTTITCPYCGKPAKLIKGSEIYCGRASTADLNYWECLPCDAHVGTHKGTVIPLGSLANHELRTARSAAHKAFDPLWLNNKKRGRTTAYLILQRQFHLTIFEAHIGMFTIAQCEKLIKVCNNHFANGGK